MNDTRRLFLRLSLVTLAACAVAGCAADTDPNQLKPGAGDPAGPAVGDPGGDDPGDVEPNAGEESWDGHEPQAAGSEQIAPSPDEHADEIGADDPSNAAAFERGVDIDPTEIDKPTASTPLFQMPFPCGQVWSGQTRTNHVPLRAVDFNRYADYGDTVVAAASGKVRVVANYGSRGYGRWIEITHANGYATRYAHLSVQAVRVGQYVYRGQRIGNVGNTGGSTGSHLHYELLRYGTAIRALFNGSYAYYYGTRSYRSYNCR